MKTYSTIEPFYDPIIEWQINKVKGISEMTRDQGAFLCGLIRDFRPQKILEVGVASGGTTVNIMRCLDALDIRAEMYSVDLNKDLYYDCSRETGFFAKQYLSENGCKSMHHFLLGDYLPERLDGIGKGIDFVILDTVHLLPGELLDFLAVFPFLKENAVIVLHDVIMSHENSMNDRYCLATQVLYSSVFADKILNNSEEYPNIAAFRINKFTEDSIFNVFSALTLTWRYVMGAQEEEIYRKWYLKYYSPELCKIYDQAVLLNKNTLGKRDESIKYYYTSIKGSILSRFKHILLYGYGKRGKAFYNDIHEYDEGNIQFVVSTVEEAEEKNCLSFKDIPYSKDETIILLTANSEEIKKALSLSDWYWIDIPGDIWRAIERA